MKKTITIITSPYTGKIISIESKGGVIVILNGIVVSDGESFKKPKDDTYEANRAALEYLCDKNPRADRRHEVIELLRAAIFMVDGEADDDDDVDPDERGPLLSQMTEGK